jgi:hypothetical protein
MSIFGTYARFRARAPAERRLLQRTALLFVCAHLLLRTRSLERTRQRLSTIAQRLDIDVSDTAQLAWAISTVDRNLPGKHSCLIDALCCEAIARHAGIAAELKLGAARGTERMRFHAWVEHAGITIAGAHDDEFTPLR